MGKGTLTVRILGDASGFTGAMNQAESATSRFSNGLRNFGAGMTAAVTLPLAALGASAFSAASDLEQSIGAVESVFGPASAAIEAFGRTAAESFGLSRTEVNQTAAVIGASLQSMGFDADEAAEQVINLQQRAADMAATFGGTTAEALDAVASLLRGEVDPIERYGVAMNQAAIDAEILALGLDTSTAELERQAEATAALSLLMEQTSDVQGQFARESDTAAGAQARLSARFEDLRAEIGGNLLPIFVTIAEVVSDVTSRFEGLSERGQNMVLIGGAIVAALGPLALAFSAIIPAVQAVGAVLAGISAPVAVAIVAFAALVAGLVYAYQNSEVFRDRVNAAFTEVQAFAAVVWPQVQAIIEQAITAIQAVIAHFTQVAQVMWMVFGDTIRTFAAQTWQQIQQVIGGVLDVIQGLIAAFNAATQGDWSALWEAIKQITSGAVAILQSVISGAMNAIQAVLSAALATVQTLWAAAWEVIQAAFQSAWEALTGAIKSGVANVTGIFSALPGQLLSALGNLGGLLVSAGASLVQGLVDGIMSRLNSALNAVRNMASQIAAAARDALSINSPSKVFMEIGQFAMEGMGLGMRNVQPALVDTAGDIASSITTPFEPASVGGASGGMGGMPTVNNRVNVYLDGNEIAAASEARHGMTGFRSRSLAWSAARG